MGTVKVETSAGEIEIENEYLDQAASIDAFATELCNQLLSGAVKDAALSAVIDLIKNLFTENIISIALDAAKDAISLDPAEDISIDVPAISLLGPVEIPEAPNIETLVSADELISMGQMSVGDAMSEFINKLVESITSDAVIKAIQNMVEKFINCELIEIIVDMAEEAVNNISIDGYEVIIDVLYIPPCNSIDLPEKPDPIIEIPAITIPSTGENLNIETKIKSLEDFQCDLMAPKIYKCIENMKQIVQEALESLKDDLVGSITSEIESQITSQI